MDCPANTADARCATATEHVPFFTLFSDNGKDHPLAGHTAGSDSAHGQQATANLVKAGTLPPVQIEQHGQAHHHWYDAPLEIGEDLAVGAYHEVTQHPGRVALSFAIGVGTAAIASAVSAPVAIAATVAGLGYGAYQIYEHAPGWIHAVEGIAHPENHTLSELAKDHKVAQDFGGGVTDIAAGIAGGVAYRYASSAIAQALEESANAHPVKTAATSSTTTDDGGTTQHAVNGAAAGNTGDGGAGHHAAVVPGQDTNAHHAATVAGTNGGDGKLPEVASQASAPAALTPEEQAMANSVKATQSIFRGATADGGSGVVESTKQLYNVRFEPVTEDAGRTLITLENRTTGALVPKGNWIATRLDASGNPVIEDGIQNSWSIQPAKLLKTYQIGQEALDAGKPFVAATRTDGPSVHMVQLDKPLEIMTKWGSMKAKIGDWLANYDYNHAAGQPGNDYAIVSKESYSQTYQPKVK